MIKLHFILPISFIFCIVVSCSKKDDNNSVSVTTSSPNILFIIADDLGKDAIKGYQEGSIKPNTPILDSIRDKGLIFTNFWVNPTCTPTRSAIITGKYGYRTGMKGVGDVLNSTETVLQKYINSNTGNKYATAIVGKWHLSGNNAGFNPETFGIDYYAGLIRGAVEDYYQWQLTEDGSSSLQTTYITEKFTDLAIDWVNAQSKPWFLWLAYNAPHTPFHVPPSKMHQQGNLPAYTNGMDATPYFMAAIEAMDYQIGRFLNNIPEDEKDNTIIIFIGDNGTTNLVAQSPYSNSKVKNTLYQGGINTPLFVSGKGVDRVGTDNQLLNGTDLFATIAQIAGVNVNEYQDSKSFKSLFTQTKSIRNYQYSELKDGVEESWTISNGTYKLLIKNSAPEMYNLTADPYENMDLLKGDLSVTEQNAKIELESELSKIRK
jgi:arylsulfatase B